LLEEWKRVYGGMEESGWRNGREVMEESKRVDGGMEES
jgi:hypothetical protein